MFRMCNIQYLSSNMSYSWSIVVWNDLANLEVLHVSHAVDNFLRLLAERIERTLML